MAPDPDRPKDAESTGSRPRLLASLARQAGWTESLSDEFRREIMEGIRADLRQPGIKPRDKKRLMDTLFRMEAADVSRGRLLLDAGKVADPDQGTGDELLRDLEEAKKRRGGVIL